MEKLKKLFERKKLTLDEKIKDCAKHFSLWGVLGVILLVLSISFEAFRYDVFAIAVLLLFLSICYFGLGLKYELIKKFESQNQVKAIVLDMPLLVEVGWHKRCDKLIFVNCEKKLRLQRAKKMGFDKNQVKIRENFQISLDNKASLADNTIENNSDLSAIANQVTGIFSYIVNNG